MEYKRAMAVHAILLKDMDHWKFLLLVIDVTSTQLIVYSTLYTLLSKKTLTIASWPTYYVRKRSIESLYY